MTDEQIVKALEICNSLSQRCGDGCPYYTVIYKNGKRCSEMMIDDTLDLIKRQKAEIEDLKADKEAIINGQLTIQKMYIEARDKAVREFAERLKETNLYEFIEEYFDNAELCYEVRSDLFNDFVDNLVIEMTEEKENG